MKLTVLSVVLALLVFVCTPVAHSQAHTRSPKISVTYPVNGGRVVTSDAITFMFDVQNFNIGSDGYLNVYGTNGKLGATIQQKTDRMIVADLPQGLHRMIFALVDFQGKFVTQNASVNFQKFDYPERVVFDDFSVAPEYPRGDGTLSRDYHPSLEQFQFETVSESDNEALASLRKLFLRKVTSQDSLNQISKSQKILDIYSEFHKDALANPSDHKFLIYRTTALGLGNQFETLVSTFVFAMLTERVLLVDAATIHHLLQPPSGISWHWQTIFDLIGEDTIQKSAKLVNLQWQNPKEFPSLLCANLDEEYPEQFLFVFSDQYYLPALRHSPVYKDLVLEWFGNSDIFGILSRHLLVPRPWIATEIMEFYNANMRDRTTVGLQVRTATMKGFDAEFVAWDEFGFHDYPNAYAKCGLMSALGLGKVDESLFFLATDNKAIRPRIKQELGSNKVLMFEKEITRKINSGHATALIDMMLLSLCDDLVVTSMSTFGYVAAGLSSASPLLLNFQAQCTREQSSQPCFHKWSFVFPGHCYNKTAMLSHDVRFCGPLAPPYTLVEPVW